MILRPSFKKRSEKKEILDLETRPLAQMRRIYRLMGYVNRFLGGENTILHQLERFSKNWPKDKVIRILDVGTGDAFIPRAVIRWARKHGWAVQVTALDICAESLSLAREEIHDKYPEINVIRASVYELPFQAGAFDYVTASMFFHHLPDEAIPRVLKKFDVIASRGMVVNDLLRRRRAYWGILFVGLFVGDSVFLNDAPLSVLRGFRLDEAAEFIRQSGLNYLSVETHYAHRLAIRGEKHGAF